MDGIYLLLGTNMGSRFNNLLESKDLVEQLIGPSLLSSSVYETAAWGMKDQPKFLNQVLKVKSQLDPYNIISTIQRIEKTMGRERKRKWAERIIDVDILYFFDQIISSKQLTLPHPEIPNRRFTLVPLSEIAPLEIHPVLNLNQITLLQQCEDPLKVEKFS